MPKLQEIYRHLRQLNSTVVDQAMAEALHSADDEARRLLTLSLLERGHDDYLDQIVSIFHDLDSDLQEIIIHHAVDLDGALRRMATSEDLQARINCVQIIIQSQSFRLAYLLTEQLRSDQPRLTRLAAQGLLELTEHVTQIGLIEQSINVSKLQTKRLAWLENALAEAAATYGKHGRQDILLAIASLAPRRLPELQKHLNKPHSAVHQALISHMLTPRHNAIARAMLSYANEESFRPKVIEALAREDTHHILVDIMYGAHLTAIPQVRKAVRGVVNTDNLIPDKEQRNHWPVERLRLLPRWFASLRVDAAVQIQLISELAAVNDPITRMNALHLLTQYDHPDANDAIALYCFDTEQSVARVALRHLMINEWPGLQRILPRLLYSPHHDITALAEAAFLPETFERLWKQWYKLAPEVRTAAGRALLRLDRQFKTKLAAQMESPESQARLQAVMVARSLRIADYYETELVRLVEDKDEKVVSAVVAALGAIQDTPEIVAGLKRALSHHNDRVRANAIESIERIERVDETQQQLLELATQSEGNRSRANAIKALLNLPFGQAMNALANMLRDTDPRHRISGLWVVNESHLFDIAELVGELAMADTSQEVRRRAGLALRQLAQARKGFVEQNQQDSPAQPVNADAQNTPPQTHTQPEQTDAAEGGQP